VVRAVFDGIACTGFGEVSLTSLSSTDHSQITEMLRRLALGLRDTGVSLSLPSQRLDAFGVAMAQLIASGERKTGLTFAPEAGTQRLRDVINKNVKEADLTEAVRSAFEQGWRRCKLYFMIGLPSERDEDVEGIAHMANRAYATAKEAAGEKDRNNVRLGVSVAVFVPKAHTPFQWCGQIRREEADRRIGLIKAAGLHRGIDLHCHNPASALIEAVMARGDRSLAPLLEAAWRAGASFDAWTERFSLEAWHTAAQQTGIDFAALASRDLPRDAGLPWDHLSTGIDKRYLLEEHERSMAEMTTDDCTYASCTGCGACGSLGAQTELGGGARG
jgi:radical SAM superfamily enzyme YgiQ (UPF0313 family)